MAGMAVDDREKVLGALRATVHQDFYEVWCRPLTFEGDPSDGYTIPVSNPYHKALMERDLRTPIEEAFRKVFGRSPKIVFAVRAEPAPPPAVVPPPPPPRAPLPIPAAAPPIRAPQLNAELTFDRFIIGPSNRFAHAASVAVAATPGTVYNPLFIHGSVGLGKTHLLQAICHELLRHTPAPKIYFLPCESFVNEYIIGVQKNSLAAFRSRYRNADILFVDDIHFLAGKEASQEEFFHTYNALHGSGRQMVLASDSQPKDIQLIQEQLISRFNSGLVVRVDTPAFETRVALLDARARERGHTLPEDVTHFIASNIQSNFRELEGAVNKLIAFSSVSGRKIDVEMSQEVLRDLLEVQLSPVEIPDIKQIVADYFKVTISDLAARRWTKSTSLPRQMAIYLSRKHTNRSLKEIGAHFGGKDHATVVYAVRRVEELAKRQEYVRSQLETLNRHVRQRL